MIKKADKGSCVVVWGRNNYLLEVETQLSDIKVYRNVSNTENIPSKLLETNNRMLSRWQDDKKFTMKWLLFIITHFEVIAVQLM